MPFLRSQFCFQFFPVQLNKNDYQLPQTAVKNKHVAIPSLLGFEFWVSGIGVWVLVFVTDYCNEVAYFACQASNNIKREEKAS
jgi:hypothetical protein